MPKVKLIIERRRTIVERAVVEIPMTDTLRKMMSEGPQTMSVWAENSVAPVTSAWVNHDIQHGQPKLLHFEEVPD